MDGALTPTPFWDYLQAALSDLNISMTELGRRSGVKTQAIYKWKKAQPSVTSVRKISKALDADPRLLLVLSGHMDESELEAQHEASNGTLREQMDRVLGPPEQRRALEEALMAPVKPSGLAEVEAAIMDSGVFTPEQKAALIQTARAFQNANGRRT